MKRLLLGALALCFFCSGLSALIYQVLWLRMLGWVFGVTIYAASAVWAIFMAGLALGSIAAGLAADRVRNPSRWFGVTEVLIGLTAVTTPPFLGILQRVYVSLFSSASESMNAVTAARLVLAFALLIVPTALMGVTLPLVIKASTFRASALGGQVGLLYGSNAAGAIVGTLVAGLYLIPALGIHRTFLVAAALNLVVGATAIALSALVPRLDVRDVAPDVPASAKAMAGPPELVSARLASEGGKVGPTDPKTIERGLRVVLLVFALSGFVSLALEVVWFRVLTLFLRPTVYGFSVMLAMILAGISLGSYLVTPLLARRMRWMTLLAGLELAIGIAIVWSFRPLVYLNDMTARLAPSLTEVMPEYLVYPLAGSLLAIFPTALLMGVAFPIGLHLWAAAGAPKAHTAERVGCSTR